MPRDRGINGGDPLPPDTLAMGDGLQGGNGGATVYAAKALGKPGPDPLGKTRLTHALDTLGKSLVNHAGRCFVGCKYLSQAGGGGGGVRRPMRSEGGYAKRPSSWPLSDTDIRNQSWPYVFKPGMDAGRSGHGWQAAGGPRRTRQDGRELSAAGAG